MVKLLPINKLNLLQFVNIKNSLPYFFTPPRSDVKTSDQYPSCLKFAASDPNIRVSDTGYRPSFGQKRCPSRENPRKGPQRWASRAPLTGNEANQDAVTILHFCHIGN